MGGRRGVRGGPLVVVVLVVAGVLVVGGCGKAKPAKPLGALSSVRPGGSASPSVDASTAAATAEVLQIYNGYAAASTKAYQTADYRMAADEFPKYLAEPLLDSEVTRVYQLSEKGAVYDGALVQSPRVTTIQLTGSPTATIDDCYDFTNWHAVDKNSHSPYPRPSGSPRYIIVSTLTLVAGKGWRITDEQKDRTRSC